MTTPNVNVLLLLDSHIVAALDDVRAEKIEAMDAYTDAARKESELLALLELRRRSGARIAGLPTLATEAA